MIDYQYNGQAPAQEARSFEDLRGLIAEQDDVSVAIRC